MRHEFETLEQNGITAVALPRIADPSVIPLWFGEGDIVTPGFIRDAAKRALDDGLTFYDHPCGRADFRAAIKAYLDRLYGIEIDAGRVAVPGSTMLGIFMAARMAAGAGDHALIVSPNWPNIDRAFQMTGCTFDFVRQRLEAGGWRLALEDLFAAARPDTRALFLNSPCNPTGWVMPAGEQRRLLDFCREREIVIIADEVYHRNVFEDDAAPSFLEVSAPDDPPHRRQRVLQGVCDDRLAARLDGRPRRLRGADGRPTRSARAPERPTSSRAQGSRPSARARGSSGRCANTSGLRASR